MEPKVIRELKSAARTQLARFRSTRLSSSKSLQSQRHPESVAVAVPARVSDVSVKDDINVSVAEVASPDYSTRSNGIVTLHADLHEQSPAVLFTNATIITYDTALHKLKTLRNASLLVQDGRITELSEGTVENLPGNVEVVDATGKIICPGFVDTHHHMWQTAFRSIAADTTLMEYFARYDQTSLAHTTFTPEDTYLSQMAAALEMIDCGTTTVLDHAHGTFSEAHIDACLQASFECGLRLIYAHNIDVRGSATGMSFAQSLSKFKSLLNDQRFADRHNPVQLGLACDGFAFASPDMSMQVMDTVIEHNNSTHQSALACITTHFVAGPYGATSSPACLHSMPKSVITQPSLKKKLPVILSHASFMDNKDALLIRQHEHISISTTPESECHYGHTSTGADLSQNCASLGVDTQFTFSSYMPFQARLWLQQLRSKYYAKVCVDDREAPANSPMTVESAFLLMTQKGGQALGRDDIGVIRVGAQADLVVFDMARPGLWAARDPVAAVVLHTGGSGDIDSVMVSGKWLKKDHHILFKKDDKLLPDVTEIRRKFEGSASRIQKLWEAMDKPEFEIGKDTGFGLAKFGRCKEVQARR